MEWTIWIEFNHCRNIFIFRTEWNHNNNNKWQINWTIAFVSKSKWVAVWKFCNESVTSELSIICFILEKQFDEWACVCFSIATGIALYEGWRLRLITNVIFGCYFVFIIRWNFSSYSHTETNGIHPPNEYRISNSGHRLSNKNNNNNNKWRTWVLLCADDW